MWTCDCGQWSTTATVYLHCMVQPRRHSTQHSMHTCTQQQHHCLYTPNPRHKTLDTQPHTHKQPTPRTGPPVLVPNTPAQALHSRRGIGRGSGGAGRCRPLRKTPAPRCLRGRAPRHSTAPTCECGGYKVARGVCGGGGSFFSPPFSTCGTIGSHCPKAYNSDTRNSDTHKGIACTATAAQQRT